MSINLYPQTAQLRFWSEAEIEAREALARALYHAVREPLTAMNRAWQFERVEGPLLTPISMVSKEYGEDDVWAVFGEIGGEGAAMRPETTASSYVCARHLVQSGKRWPPLCVWQAGKSFRREQSDGASASKLRYFEFYQLEFQCIYSTDTKADYRPSVVESIAAAIGRATGSVRTVESDRLPSYSERTQDVEFLRGDRWVEAASISTRTDFGSIGGKKMSVLEVAVGLDRLLDCAL